MRDAVIIDAVRPPVGKGKPGGALSDVHPVDIHAFEVNEALASVVLAWQPRPERTWARSTSTGGATAVGHPLGASGPRS
jgi:acetyl-CoA acetyltransferase